MTKKEMTAVEYVALVAGGLIEFAQRTDFEVTKPAALWKKEAASYLRSRRLR